MPIDPTPEGGEILHQPVVKPFPENKPEPDDKPEAGQGEQQREKSDAGRGPANGWLDGQTQPPR